MLYRVVRSKRSRHHHRNRYRFDGAVIPNAPVQAKNAVTGVVYDGATSSTGNYTISQLPVGSYQISVSAPGFKNIRRARV